MPGKRIVFFVMIVVAVLTCLYVYFAEKPAPEQSAPPTVIENVPVMDKTMPNKENTEPSATTETHSRPPSASSDTSTKPTFSLPPVSHGDPVNLEEQSYSIRNEKKTIPITPGVVVQPGTSINVKIPGGDEIIRVQRDKVNHPGGYNVLWEKKY